MDQDLDDKDKAHDMRESYQRRCEDQALPVPTKRCDAHRAHLVLLHSSLSYMRALITCHWYVVLAN